MPNENYPGALPAAARAPDLLRTGQSQIEDLVALGVSVLHGMWRYRWPSLLLAWVICVVGWTIVYALPDVYQASTRVYIDAESMIKRAVGDLTLAGDTMTEINILTRAMLSQPQLEKTAQLANLDLEATTPQEHEQLIADIGRRVILAKEGGENIFRISFQDSSRQTAETVVQTLLDSFREDAYGERRTDSNAASAFIGQQIVDYERRLDEAEVRLATFKRDNIGLMPGETGDYYTRLQRAMQTLAESRAELRLANERRTEYQLQLEGEQPVFGIVGPAGPTVAAGGAADATIAQYQNEINALLLKFTENHPDVIALRETIARLKAEQPQSGPRAPVAYTAAGNLQDNPVYQRMRMGLSETEVEIATLRSKITAEEAAVQELQRLVDTVPEIERQLTAMNRDYEVTRGQYDELLKRRESLHITGEVEQTGDQLQFRVIDPPRASLAPVGPNRLLFLMATAVVALGAALALAFGLQHLYPVFVSRRELREITGLPVLGSVSFARSPADRLLAKRRVLAFSAVAAALPIALGLAVLVQGPASRLVSNLFSVWPS
jgi:polysaccharide chain length determinant protein (PEP-CTERM system associated)